MTNTSPYAVYSGNRRKTAASHPVEIPTTRLLRTPHPECYLPSPSLVDAANVALHLGQPLLLTGEPGTGKTQFAYSLAWELGFGSPLKFETKSNSESRDLFYYYNSIGRFHAAQTKEGSQNSVDYITYNALGLAILRSKAFEDIAQVVPNNFQHEGPTRSVVLIDEVDKAPRDFPNDILNELEGMYFRVPELGNAAIHADTEMPPIVIITSNSERHLPDAFLRRCVYHHIEFPSRESLEEIILAHFGDAAGAAEFDRALSAALSLFFDFRGEAGNWRKPATAELLGWLAAIQRKIAADRAANLDEILQSTIGCIAKTPESQKVACAMVAG